MHFLPQQNLKIGASQMLSTMHNNTLYQTLLMHTEFNDLGLSQ